MKATKKTDPKTTTDTGPKTEDIKLDDIKVEGDIQQRGTTDRATVDAYTEAIKGDAEFRPLIVYRVGDDLILADGFHRRTAYRNAGKETAPCLIVDGTRDDAKLFAATDANRTNGLRMTRDDKRKAVKTVLAIKGAAWSSRDIAKAVGVSHTFVDNVKDGPSDSPSGGNVATPTAQQVDAAIAACRQNSRNPRELKKAASDLGKLANDAIKAVAQRSAAFADNTDAAPAQQATTSGTIPDAALNSAPTLKYVQRRKPVAV